MDMLKLYLEEEKSILSELIDSWRNLNNKNLVVIDGGKKIKIKSSSMLKE